MDTKKTGRLIAQLRKEKGLTQSQLANELNIKININIDINNKIYINIHTHTNANTCISKILILSNYINLSIRCLLIFTGKVLAY